MHCLSLDHKRAGVAERQVFAFTSSERAALGKAFAAIGGCVPLVTCNRTEIYFLCSREEAERILEKFAGKPLNFSFYGEEDAERHLFRLAAGLESMLIGEDEILGQIRKAYEEARYGGYAAGADALFQAAIACGKKVRSETSVSAYACSVATLAVNEAFRFAKSRQRENAGADTEKPVALLVGATGGIGANVLKNLLSKNIFRIVATSRKHGGIATAEGVESADYSARYSLLDGADVVISATSSPHTVFGAAKVRKSLSTKKTRLFIDLSVPPDIDRKIGALKDCSLTGMDEFSVLAEENNKKKARAAREAERIVAACFLEYCAGDAARVCAHLLSALPQSEKKRVFSLRKENPAAFVRFCREGLSSSREKKGESAAGGVIREEQSAAAGAEARVRADGGKECGR